jgi:hypothetical protein
MAQEFEEHVRLKLVEDLREDGAEPYRAAYALAKPKLIRDIYSQVRGVEPDLSDHSERHVDNVLHTTRRLLVTPETGRFTGIELYCLSMFILFHDVGNLFGRENHHKHVGDVYDWVRGVDPALRRERTLVLKAAQAHTGSAADGSSDTLKELNEHDHLDDHPIRLRELAGVLRFADELAEGPQRTSEFMRTRHAYAPDSQVFHDYASITHVNIDRPGGRIRLTYEIDVTPDGAESQTDRDRRLTQLLEFAYRRVQKLDQERRYAKYYCPVLAPFRLTSVEINFHSSGHLLPVSLPPLQLDDKVVPGDPAKTVPELQPEYGLDNVFAKIAEAEKAVGA